MLEGSANITVLQSSLQNQTEEAKEGQLIFSYEL